MVSCSSGRAEDRVRKEPEETPRVGEAGPRPEARLRGQREAHARVVASCLRPVDALASLTLPLRIPVTSRQSSRPTAFKLSNKTRQDHWVLTKRI